MPAAVGASSPCSRVMPSCSSTARNSALTLLKAYGGEGEIAELRQFAQGAIPTVQKHHDWLEKNTPQPGTAMAGGQATPTP